MQVPLNILGHSQSQRGAGRITSSTPTRILSCFTNTSQEPQAYTNNKSTTYNSQCLEDTMPGQPSSRRKVNWSNIHQFDQSLYRTSSFSSEKHKRLPPSFLFSGNTWLCEPSDVAIRIIQSKKTSRDNRTKRKRVRADSIFVAWFPNRSFVPSRIRNGGYFARQHSLGNLGQGWTGHCSREKGCLQAVGRDHWRRKDLYHQRVCSLSLSLFQ